MKDVVVVTSCTGRLGLADAYDRRLTDAGIDHVFETTPYATSSFRMEQRIAYWRRLAEQFFDYKMLIVTDAWDVLFVGTKEALLSNSHAMLISAERNCFPGPEYGEEDLTYVIKGETPWRYSNPGMIAANPNYLLRWLDQAEKRVPLDISDQAWCNRCLVNAPWLISLDENTEMFYVISYSDGRLEDGALQLKEGRLWNSKCDTYPAFIHFAGHGPQEPRRVIPGQEAPRYEAMRVIRSYLELGR